MEKFASATSLISAHKPERPVLGLRPKAAGRAARWFIDNFDGDVAYAYKANSSVFLIGALYGAGIRHFDVASLPELEDAATIPGVALHFMHPVKSRSAIRRAYDLGVRSFALDSEDELQKIVEETTQSSGPAKDLNLFVRVSVPAMNSLIPLERKFGIGGKAAAELLVKTRQVAQELGIAFHVGSQTTQADAFVSALQMVRGLIRDAGVVVDRIDVGGGFPARYPNSEPAGLGTFMKAINEGVEELPVRESVRLMCEPGRALVAEAESLIVRVDARRGNVYSSTTAVTAHCLMQPTSASSIPRARCLPKVKPPVPRRSSIFGDRRAIPSTTCPDRSNCQPTSRKATTSRSETSVPTGARWRATSTAMASTMRSSCSMSR